MQQTIGIAELQHRFRSFFDDVVQKHTSYVLMNDLRPEAVLIPYVDYLRYQEVQKSEVLAQFDQVWERLASLNAKYSDDEITADIEKARDG